MRVLFLGVVGLVSVAVVAVAAFVGLSFMSAPEPSCADGPIAVSGEAAQSFDIKWKRFDASLKQGSVAKETFTEEELTSRAVRFIEEEDILVTDVQIHLCPGESKGQALGKVSILGRDLDVVIAGHLDLDTDRPDLVLDSVEVGRVPHQLTTWVVQNIIDITHIENIEITIGIDVMTTSTDAVTLRGQR